MDPTINPQVHPTISSCSSCWPACNEEPLQLETEAFPEEKAEFTFFLNNTGFIRLRVRASHNAHIALTVATAKIVPMYEIVIGSGGAAGTIYSTIRKNGKGVTTVSTPGILNPNEFRGFWIRWENCTISVGREYEVPPFMGWTDSQRVNIEYNGICTKWNIKGSWILEPTRGYVPTNDVCCCARCDQQQIPNYYWRDFQGKMPSDAVPAGNDGLYVGQGFGETGRYYGITPVGIRNLQEVIALPHGIIPAIAAKYNAKILCSTSTARLKWMPITASSFFNDLLGKNPILGGLENQPGAPHINYIGRCIDNGKYYVGKIETFSNTAVFWYVGPENRSKSIASFEVLVIE